MSRRLGPSITRPKRAASASGFSVRTGYTPGLWIDQVDAAASHAGHSVVYFALSLRAMVGDDCLHAGQRYKNVAMRPR
jgi:hypothetical protein